ncbi:DUF2252 domain-containing protein [Streptomyces sp. MST-110588]|uniref:DUF2252 domain-containing protein n=1 Tax=Streptomyces sp. MST-110588 TaxID=2833628 RepID=UPI001F5CC73F|nr:DUF2252 domain-containing protein [Streptomyces sp. MST-110588]UNO40997.1 DUF2252 domain-containing protein [Streptomyces sp. MST-110588]
MTRLPYVPGFAKGRTPGASAGPGPATEPGPKAAGKALRSKVPRSAHSELIIGAGRPDAASVVEESNAGRLAELTPIRVGRMAASPFAFLRGTAGLMAYDLMSGPVTGIGAQICGDAHAGNFGLYGDARGRLVMDLNDFDETLYGPWEWDLKRLVTSLVLAGREAGAGEDACRDAARDAAGAYRRTMRLLAAMPAADAWNAIADEELVSHADARDLLGTLKRVSAKARKNTSARFAAKSTEDEPGGGRRFVDAPPVLRRIPDEEAAAVASSLAGYLETLPEDKLPLLARYAVQDVAFRVVGTGSVGLRSYVVLLLDHRGEPLVLQVKEVRTSALAPYVEKAGFPVPAVAHEGRRVVLGQRQMQVVSDPLLGWTTVPDQPIPGVWERPARTKDSRKGEGRGASEAEETANTTEATGPTGRKAETGAGTTVQAALTRMTRHPGSHGYQDYQGYQAQGRSRVHGREGVPFQVRQFRNRKGSVDPAALSPDQIDDYARMTGALLARAHAHSADPRLVAGYCGKNEELDEALAAFAVAYADLTESDHEDLIAAIGSGRIAAEPDV